MSDCHYHVTTVGTAIGSQSAIYKNGLLAKIRYAHELDKNRKRLNEKEIFTERLKGDQKASFSDGSVVRVYSCDSDCLDVIEKED